MHVTRLTAFAALLALAGCGHPADSTDPTGALQSQVASRATLTGSVPPWASSTSFKTAAAGSESISFRVYLNWQSSAGLDAFVQAVSDPRSASYGQYLTPAQFRAQYAPTNAQAQAVQQWLRGAGLSIVYTPANNHFVSVQGTVAEASAAFGVTFAYYTVQGMTLRAPTSDLTIPASLSGIVAAVAGADQTHALVRNHIAHEPHASPAAAFVSAPPCSVYWGEKLATGFPNPYGSGALPYTPCGYSPAQVKGAYGLSGYDGAGQTVVVIDAFASPTIAQDVNTWSSLRGLPPVNLQQVVAPGNYRQPETWQDPQGWYGEETLDIEAVHGMAPAAKVVFVASANANQDLDAALNHVVDNKLAPIVTNSYGWSGESVAPGFVKPYQDIFRQAVAQGMGVYFSSGDDSDESLIIGRAEADWPASSPLVTAVGGTSLAVGSRNEYLFETGWGTARGLWNGASWDASEWIYGAGGGVSKLFAEPWYQQGVVPQSEFTRQGRTGRAVPDVSALADVVTGLMVGQTQTFPDGSVRYAEYRIGGTSLSSPLFAGIMALADQAKGTPHGFANPVFYALAGSGAFRDVAAASGTVATVRADYFDFATPESGPLTYTLRTFEDTLSLKTVRGWDDVTGVGSPAPGFVSAMGQ